MKIITLRNKLSLHIYVVIIFWLSDHYFFLNKLLKRILCFFQLPPNSILLHIRNSQVNLLRTHIYIINFKVLDLYKNAFRLRITTVSSINKNFLKWFFISLKKGKAIKWLSTPLGLYT
ncbi:hypothetical protein SAMN04487910_4535 [Aquimarina amphilecti]|uniref:Uncharacterized protein n=1 Tax=Aquimarina amphilecti TaxID=1038014 RepID=A0A1H7WRV7_AQUAM|nr:hypothetical protein SAMN04487910_4535 [Aquimarina amphilecti]